MRRLRTWALVTAAAVLAMMLGRRLEEAVLLDFDNLRSS